MSKMIGRIFGKELSTQITFVGLANAGKTTLIKTLKGEEPETTYVPTMGMSVEALMLKTGDDEVEVLAADMGGQKSFLESFWKPFVSRSDGVVFVFDSADESNVREAAEYLQRVISWLNENSALLFLANKQDLPEAKSLESIIDSLNLGDVMGKRPHSFGVYQCSALTGVGVQNAWKWLAEKVIK